MWPAARSAIDWVASLFLESGSVEGLRYVKPFPRDSSEGTIDISRKAIRMLFLSRREVEALLDPELLVEALGPAMEELSRGTVSMPPRAGAMIPEKEAFLGVMPVWTGASGTLSAKLVTVFPGNDEVGLPSHIALIAVFDPDTGEPLAVMDGTHITAIRTAAGSALATRLMARPESRVLAIVGSGVQARSHAEVLTRSCGVEEIRIVSRDPAKATSLARELADTLNIPVRAAPSFREAAAGADILCATTHSDRPVVHWQSIDPGTHINSVGFNPAGRELDDDTVCNSLVVIESRGSTLAPLPAGSNDLLAPIEAGLITEEHVHAEIGEVHAREKAGRTSPGQVTLYKSVGVAVQDAVAARLVLDAARASGTGTQIDL